MARTCKNCYSLVNDEHKFCTQCGEKVPFPKHDETKKENEGISYPNDNSNKVVIISLLIISFFIYIIFSIFTDSHSTNNDISIDKVQKELIKIETPDLSSPEEKENLLKEAKKDYDSRNFNSAIPKYQRLLELNYKAAESNFYLGQIWYVKNKYELAISHFKKSAILNDKAAYMPTLLLHSGISFEKIIDTDKAKNFYLTLIELYPDSNEANLAKNNPLIIKINQKPSMNTRINTGQNPNNSTFQSIFEYKEWKYESFDNLFRIITNGKVGATGHEFGLIRKKSECNNNLLWMTFSTIYDLSAYIGENIKFKIIIDDNMFYLELPILNVSNVTPSLNIVGFSNFVLNDYTLSLLKKGKKIKIEIDKTNRLYDKFDIKSEEFSLEGFVANYMKLDEKCKTEKELSINSSLPSGNSSTINNVNEIIINRWKYKDWEVENIDDNYIKAFTVGKNRADVFTIIEII